MSRSFLVFAALIIFGLGPACACAGDSMAAHGSSMQSDEAVGHMMAGDADAHCHDEPPPTPKPHADCCDTDRTCYGVVSATASVVEESDAVLAFAEFKPPLLVVVDVAPNRPRVRETLPPPDTVRRRSITPHDLKVRLLI